MANGNTIKERLTALETKVNIMIKLLWIVFVIVLLPIIKYGIIKLFAGGSQ